MSFVTSVVQAPITFVTWKWQLPGSPRTFQSKHVNVMRAAIVRHYPRPFRFVCITDDPAGLDPAIDSMPIPPLAKSLQLLQNPRGERFPNCYCRLWNFSEEAKVLGARIFQIDIDVVVAGDLRPLVDREEDFVGWTDKRFEKNKIAGGAYLLKTGSLNEIWMDFDPASSPARAFAAGFKGSDQGWISYKLAVGAQLIAPSEGVMNHAPTIGTWRAGDLVKINWTQARARIPPRGARLVFTNGVKPPWSKETRNKYPWVREYWQNP